MRNNLIQDFATRLKDKMLAMSYTSPGSNSEININKLAEISGCSLEHCRDFLQGVLFPEPCEIIAISDHLNVSPSWLLFGENSEIRVHQQET